MRILSVDIFNCIHSNKVAECPRAKRLFLLCNQCDHGREERGIDEGMEEAW